jgi:hypothetical protein
MMEISGPHVASIKMKAFYGLAPFGLVDVYQRFRKAVILKSNVCRILLAEERRPIVS